MVMDRFLVQVDGVSFRTDIHTHTLTQSPAQPCSGCVVVDSLAGCTFKCASVKLHSAAVTVCRG